MRISDWSSDVCSSDLAAEVEQLGGAPVADRGAENGGTEADDDAAAVPLCAVAGGDVADLVSDHPRQLGLAAGQRHEAAGDVGVAAGQREGVHHRRIEYREGDRKRVVGGKSESGRVDPGGRRMIKKKKVNQLTKAMNRKVKRR